MTGFDYAETALDEIVAGKYRITRLIGRGGMGSVWEGTHLTLGNRVAVKFIDPAYAESPEARQRFENEARAAARLNSKYAVQVYDHGMMPDGRPFIVMEFLAGEPLDARLERELRLPLADTAQILSQVCRALTRAHAAGIVHRDLKPENVFLVWDDEDNANVAKVVDFGIAKFTDSQAGISSSTRTGSVLGTPYYMSPEQARGLRTVDYRTDIWSLGVIAYRCVVGRLPFEGESVGDLLVKICTAPLPVPSQQVPGCPAAFDAWFARALQREPSDRFANAQELAEQLMLACGLGLSRRSLASGQLGYGVEAGTNPDAQHSPQPTFGQGPVVPGVTGQVVTDTVFARTGGASAQTTRTKLYVVGGTLAFTALIGLAAFLVFNNRTDPTAAAGRDAASSSAAAALPTHAVVAATAVSEPRAASPALPSANPAITIEPAAAPVIPASSSAPLPVPAARPPVAATRPSAPRPAPSPQPGHRPANNRPIDVGY